ncbi:MAG: transposase [Planctomycetes bacterium]|nr:transposase [Planctomycetota bacterium]
MSARRFAEAVPGHLGVEHYLHWQLDVTFGGDDFRIRKGHAPANMSILMRTALSLLKRERSVRRGIQTNRKKAGRETDYLTGILARPNLKMRLPCGRGLREPGRLKRHDGRGVWEH